MRIALINEVSQASKNSIIFNELEKICLEKGFELVNIGMKSMEELPEITYIHTGLMAGLLINSKAVDFIVTGCGTGQGAMISCNNYPNVVCGLIVEPTDAFLFSQINNGNCISIPYAKGFGWGAELNLRNIFTQLFSEDAGQGYPLERAIPQQRNVEILKNVKSIVNHDMITIVKKIDLRFLEDIMSNKEFYNLFKQKGVDEKLINSVLERIK